MISMMTTTGARTMKKNNANEPTPADPVIAQFRRYQAVLADTAVAIPKLLDEQRQLRAELGRSEIAGGDVEAARERLDAIAAALASAARQRSAACDGLLAQADQLRAARTTAAEAVQQISRATIADFARRWAHAVGELSRLHSEAALLSQALHATVPTPPPYVAALSLDGTRMQVTFSGNVLTGVSLPPELSAISERVDTVDSALALVAAVAQSRELDQRFITLQRARSGNMPTMTGTFLVVGAFELLGAHFEPGQLVSVDVMGAGLLHRFWTGRQVTPMEGAAVAA
jgi:hypothetical protein